MELAGEVGRIVELLVDRREAHRRDLVELAQALEDGEADRLARDLAALEPAVVLDRDASASATARDRAVLGRGAEAGDDLVAVERLAKPERLATT